MGKSQSLNLFIRVLLPEYRDSHFHFGVVFGPPYVTSRSSVNIMILANNQNITRPFIYSSFFSFHLWLNNVQQLNKYLLIT